MTRRSLVYGAGCVGLLAAYPLLSPTARAVEFVVVCLVAIGCVGYGWRMVTPSRRLPWTLLLVGLLTIVGANLLEGVGGAGLTAGWLIDAAGNVLVLAGSLAFIVRRGYNDLGGIVDTIIVALAVGGLLWGVALPHRIGLDQSLAARTNLFVVLFALTGVLGALLRLSSTLTEPVPALWWLMVALSAGVGANAVAALAGDVAWLHVLGDLLFLAAFVASGLFGLDPTAPQLTERGVVARAEQLTGPRLVFLGVAVAIVPVVVGIGQMFGGPADGLLLAIQGVLVAALVMIRIGLLAAQRAQAEQALHHQATHDPLTHLPNRREFVDRLSEELARGSRATLLFCDLDDFKAVNDRLGHAAGDRLLIEVADRLEACVGAPHVVSRFGGDEFVILLIDASEIDGRAAADCISDALARPFRYSGGAPVRASIGVSSANHGQDPEDLIRSADRAMYAAKTDHGGPPTARR